MSLFDRIAEDRIQAAIARGELDGLPGAGRPLALDDDRLVPEHLRMAYRVLKNAGCVPAEIESLKALREAGRSLQAAGDDAARRRAWTRMQVLFMRLEAAGLARTGQAVLDEYRPKILERLQKTRG